MKNTSTHPNDTHRFPVSGEIRIVHRGEIRFLGHAYFNSALVAQERRKVLVDCDDPDAGRIRVLSLKGVFLCEALREEPLPYFPTEVAGKSREETVPSSGAL